jgi:hypothetical protein
MTEIIIRQSGARIEYESLSGDWRIVLTTMEGLSIELQPIATGDLRFGSGRNLDTLAALIVAAKADAIGRGIQWEGA